MKRELYKLSIYKYWNSMSKKSIITNKGLELLATSSKASGQYYWLGYYALAYVPSAWKSDQINLPDCAPNNFTLDDFPDERIDYRMQNITKAGDIIYNVFQGDLMGTGYRRGSDGSAGGELFGLSMYDQNIKKHYRYVLDENGNNQLLAWENEDRSNQLGSLVGAATYKGTDGYYAGAMPIPAPLFHAGDVLNKLSVSSFFPEAADSESNGSNIYKSAVYKYGANISMEYPLVSADYRGYKDSNGLYETSTYSHKTTGTQFDAFEVAAAVIPNGDETSWFSAYSTKVNDVGGYTNTVADTMWKIASISNYNRFHAPTSAFGHTLNSDLSTRNMATTTKFFPISNYKVINSVAGFTADSQYREVATSLAVTIDIDLAPSTKTTGYDESNFNYDENSNLTFFDKYNSNAGDFAKTSTSFKFNRIGIYAVALTDSPFAIRRADDTELPGTVCDVQFSVDPNVEPVLFAVVDFDNTVYLSDTGDGLHRFRGDINLNFDASGDASLALDSALCRDSVIFYNMYQDDALTWYQNQLISTASTQNAIMEFGLELTNLKSRLAEISCCQSPNFDGRYALKNHNHGKSLRNIEDALIASDGGLRGVDAAKDGDNTGVFSESPYFMGDNAVALGKNTYAHSDYVLVSGKDNIVYGGVGYSSYNASTENKNKSIGSILLGGSINAIFNAASSLILSSDVSCIQMTYGTAIYYSSIIASANSRIDSSNSLIANSQNASIIDCVHPSIILGGNEVSIHVSSGYSIASDEARIDGGIHNAINNTINSSIISSSYSLVEGSNSCRIENSDSSAIFNSQNATITNDIDSVAFASFIFGCVTPGTSVNNSTNCFLFGGSNDAYYNAINDSERLMVYGNGLTISNAKDSIIGGHNYDIKNTIKSIIHMDGLGVVGGTKVEDLAMSAVFGGYHKIHNSLADNYFIYSLLVSGSYHEITSDSSYSSVFGLSNTIRQSRYSCVSGMENTIFDSAASSISGQLNSILYVANNSTIIGGDNNTIATQFDSSGISHAQIIRGNSVILGGSNCTANHYGEIAHSNGKIATDKNTWFNGYNHDVHMKSELTGTITTSKGPHSATSKHSVYMLGGVVDAFMNDPQNAKGARRLGIVYDSDKELSLNTGVSGSDIANVSQLLTLNNTAFTELDIKDDQNNVIDVMLTNSINLQKGESITGTVKFLVHVPYSHAASNCKVVDNDEDEENGDFTTENNSGLAFSSLYSITAHRDVVGRITITTQLIDETAAIMNLTPPSHYGIETSIKAYSEYMGVGASLTDGTSSGFKTGMNGTTAQKYTGFKDGHIDTKDEIDGKYSGLVLRVALNCNWYTIMNIYSCRYLFCSAVVDVVSINTGDRLFPTIEAGKST